MNNLKSLFVLIIGITALGLQSCKKPFTEIEKVEIENKGTVKFENGLTLVISNPCNIHIKTNPEDSKLFYSINNAATKKLNEYWFAADSTMNFIDLYTTHNKKTNECYRINFSTGADELNVANVKMYPNPTNDFITFNLIGRNRGEIKLEVFSVNGSVVISEINYFKGQDEFEASFYLGEFDNGVYFLQVTYGTTTAYYRMIKN